MSRLPVLVLNRDFSRDQAILNANNRRSLGLREAPTLPVMAAVGASPPGPRPVATRGSCTHWRTARFCRR